MSLTTRQDAVLRFRDMRSLRKMMMALSSDFKDWRRSKGGFVTKKIDELKDQLSAMRKQQRDCSYDPYQVAKNFCLKEEKEIRRKLTGLCQKRRFREKIIVGGADTGTCEYKKEPKSRFPEVTMIVGHMWNRRVWENIYKEDRFIQNEYIILSAVEYRTNVPHVRLFEVAAYGIKEKGQVSGWIGQSKMGKQNCAFRTDKIDAIRAAERLTVAVINQQLKPTEGETK